MRGSWFGLAVLGLSAALWAQQGSTGTQGGSAQSSSSGQSSSGSSSGNSSNSNSAGTNPSQSNSPQQPSSQTGSTPTTKSGSSNDDPDLATHQPVDSLSRDTTFPGDRPQNPPAPAHKPPDLSPPRSDRVNASDLGNDIGESSSKSTQVDLSPPENDARAHPKSSDAVGAAEAASGEGDVAEFHPWNPHKAAKDVEVGDFYFKRKNYRAAEDRYREALLYKENDAIATYRLAVCLEKLNRPDDALAEYESYLKILPYGPQASDSQKAVERLKAVGASLK